MTKVKLAQPGLMNGEQVDPERYTKAVRGRSWSYKMKHAVLNNIIFHKNICYINELLPEQQSSSESQIRRSSLHIPPFILLHMLEFLCCRHVDPMRAQAALNHLKLLVHHDRGMLVNRVLKDISWEILGICQHMTGNHKAALYSYRQSLKQFPLHKIDTATQKRIQDLNIIDTPTQKRIQDLNTIDTATQKRIQDSYTILYRR